MRLLYYILIVLVFGTTACAKKQSDHSLERILEQNELSVLLRANSSDYFIYRGFPMGFQLELTQLFADYLGVNLRVVSTENSEESFQFILDEKIDIVASNITISMPETSKKSRKQQSVQAFCFTPFETERSVSWGVLCLSDSLKNVMIPWIDEISQTRKFTYLSLKYHIQPKRRFLQCDSTSQPPDRLSPFDDAIKKHTKRLDWDWRLLASLIYQESNFLPDAKSWAGAIGLMQLMPETAEKYGITEESSPEEHILAGVKYLQHLDKILPPEIPQNERVPFMLAAYNVGIAHILDARRLAVANDKDPNIWFDHVEVELLKKSDRSIVRDSVVRYGYARGQETVDLVRDVLERWQHYQNLIK
ncbi:MAG: transglycosylase SLT domain-containing protein [Bacteroidales bacterium]|nr:transglycosylase SLT domain-containing protein [Bacteroidales bacterium]